MEVNDMNIRPADCLEGIDLPDRWHVESKLIRHPKSTGGCFSVSYIVKNNEGKKAFLKAMDLFSALRSKDFMFELRELTNAFIFERDLLEKCKECSRVVTPITSGYVDVSRFGELGKVPYFIFELAEHDIRSQVYLWKEFDIAWALRSLHHSSVGLQQLQIKHIAHQDIKPSNVLYYTENGSQLSDLACSSYASTPSRNDEYQIAGDPEYAAPELFYGWSNLSGFERRFIADLYLLGNLVYFFFLGTSATAVLWYILSNDFKGQFKRSSFEEDLPYLQSAFSKSLSRLEASELLSEYKESGKIVVQIARELCEPDPRRRGNPRIFGTVIPQWDVQTYITRFDLLARRAERRLVL